MAGRDAIQMVAGVAGGAGQMNLVAVLVPEEVVAGEHFFSDGEAGSLRMHQRSFEGTGAYGDIAG